MLGNTWYYYFTGCRLNLQEVLNLFQFSLGQEGQTIEAKFTIFGEFSCFQAKFGNKEIRGIQRIWASCHF